MIVDEKMAGAAILCGEPLIGYSPTDIRQWLQENGHTDAAIAEAMAAVGQKVGWCIMNSMTPITMTRRVQNTTKNSTRGGIWRKSWSQRLSTGWRNRIELQTPIIPQKEKDGITS